MTGIQVAKYNVIITPLNGFRGTANLSFTDNNSTVFNVGLNETSVSLASGTAQTAVLSVGVTSIIVGTYQVPVTARDSQTNITQNAGLTISESLPNNEFAVFSTGTVNINGNVSVISDPTQNQGNVYGAGAVTIGGNASVIGLAESVQTVTATQGSVTGTITNGVAALAEPALNTASVKSAAMAAHTTNGNVSVSNGTVTLTGYYSGNVTLSGSVTATIKSPFYVQGAFTASNNVSISGGAIFCEGLMSLSNSVSVDSAGTTNPCLVCLNSQANALTILGSETIGGIIYCPNGGVTVGQSAEDDITVEGSVIGHGVSVGGNVTINRNTSITWPFS